MTTRPGFARLSAAAMALSAAGACVFGFGASAVAQTGLAKDSPFMPPGTPAGVAGPAETLEFAGVSVIGKKTDVILYDKSTKKSRWIGIGETVDGIAVLNYDAKREQAVIRVNGAEKILGLRHGSGPVNSPVQMPIPAVGFATPLPAPVQEVKQMGLTVMPEAPTAAMPPAVAAPPAPTKPDGPLTPEMIAHQETEARMLVSDLLEIGMAQRKAYEEAQRKAAEQAGTAQPPSPTEQPKQ